MCGIAGVINKSGASVERELIQIMNKKMIHRGPDAGGVFVEKNIGLGHRRLSIVDLSEDGNQPMFSHDGRFVIVYNGEVYNYCELKEELQQLGATFQNETDTEVILEAYRYWGTDCTKRFNGMWGFALYDREKNTIFFSRDRFGVKPLYILNTDEKLVFASEIKCITEICPEEKQVDMVQVARYLRGMQEDSDHHTFYKNIRNFPKSHNMYYDLNSHTVTYEKYWEVNGAEFKEKWQSKNPYEKCRELLEDAIRIRLRADVEVGASLSGGLDSSTIVGIVNKKYNVKMNTFSSVYDEKSCDEREFIASVNKFTDSNAHYIYPDKSADILDDVKQMMYYHDGPCQSASPYSGFCVYRGVGDCVKVMLDGQGADEIFGGYMFFYNSKLQTLLDKDTFLARMEAIRTILIYPLIWPGRANSLRKDLLKKALGEKGYKWFAKRHHLKDNGGVQLHRDMLRAEFLEIDVEDPSRVNQTLTNALDRDMNQRLECKMLPRMLHDVDRNSMARSLEVRLPFLDYRLVEFSYSLDDSDKIRGTWTKYIVRRSCKKYMPSDVRRRKNKMGFPAPFDKWLADERYRDRIKVYIDAFKARGIVDNEKLEFYYKEHLEGRVDASDTFFRIMMLEMWMQEEIDTKERKWKFVA